MTQAQQWKQWYCDLPEIEETARLDNLGMRLMGQLAFPDGRSVVDEGLLQSVLDILEYRWQATADLLRRAICSQH